MNNATSHATFQPYNKDRPWPNAVLVSGKSFVLRGADVRTPVHDPSASSTISTSVAAMAPSLPFTFRIGTPSDKAFEPFVPAVAPRSIIAAREDDNFTGNHKLVIVLVILALASGILLVIFSSRKAREQDRLAKERGAFLHGLQKRDNEPSMGEMLAAPLPALRGMKA